MYIRMIRTCAPLLFHILYAYNILHWFEWFLSCCLFPSLFDRCLGNYSTLDVFFMYNSYMAYIIDPRVTPWKKCVFLVFDTNNGRRKILSLDQTCFICCCHIDGTHFKRLRWLERRERDNKTRPMVEGVYYVASDLWIYHQ